MSCICFMNKNKSLAEKNAKIILAEIGGNVTCFIATEKIDKSNSERIPLVPAEYCPFCGKHLKEG